MNTKDRKEVMSFMAEQLLIKAAEAQAMSQSKTFSLYHAHSLCMQVTTIGAVHGHMLIDEEE